MICCGYKKPIRSKPFSTSRVKIDACHTYAGLGRSNLGAPDLTTIGTRHLGIALEIKHLQCPSCVSPGSPMPKFASLGQQKLKQLGEFLAASKGPK